TPRRQRFNKIDVKGEMTGNDTVQLPAWKAELPGRSTTACGSAPSSYQIDRKTLQVSKLPPSDDWVTWTILISGWTASQALTSSPRAARNRPQRPNGDLSRTNSFTFTMTPPCQRAAEPVLTLHSACSSYPPPAHGQRGPARAARRWLAPRSVPLA